jgi:hypothetical protein
MISPTTRSDAVCSVLADEPGVTNVIVLDAAAREPTGDVVLCDVAREAADELVSRLTELGLDEDGSIAIEEIDTALSRAARQAQLDAPGEGVDAVVWNQVEERTSEESTLSITFLVFLTIATMIAGVGVLLDQPILIVGAMVVGPEFGPIAGLCVALALGSAHSQCARCEHCSWVFGRQSVSPLWPPCSLARLVWSSRRCSTPSIH